MTETWKPVVGWTGYEVSDLGNVRSMARLIKCRDGQEQVHQGRMLATTSKADGTGYKRVHLRSPGRDAPSSAVHRLVAEAFVANPNLAPTVNHIDNDPTNNAASNLEWCTQAENLDHARRQGRMPSHWKGKRSPRAILTDEDVQKIRNLYTSDAYSYTDLATIFQVSKRAIGRVVNRETYADV